MISDNKTHSGISHLLPLKNLITALYFLTMFLFYIFISYSSVTEAGRALRRGVPIAYDHASVPLPVACRSCPKKILEPECLRRYGNKAHNQKKVPDEKMFQAA